MAAWLLLVRLPAGASQYLFSSAGRDALSSLPLHEPWTRAR